jgi:hypothetical protein
MLESNSAFSGTVSKMAQPMVAAIPQGLKPPFLLALFGTTEVVP